MEVYIITGGAGFIGSHFIRHLFAHRKAITVINIDKLTYAGNLKNLEDMEKERYYCFIQADISDQQAIAGIYAKYQPDYIVNFAAESHVDRSILDPAPFIKTNVMGTQTLLHAALAHNIKKFLQVSTDEVYGPLGPEDRPFSEDSPLLPSSPYAASKASADLLVKSYYKTFGLPVNIVRCTNNYGTHQHPEKLIPALIKNYRLKKSLPLYGDGQNSREWLFVGDCCRAIDVVLHKGSPGQTYNIGSGVEKKNIETARLLLSILQELSPERKLLSEHIEIQFVEDRKGHDRRYAVKWDKIRQELGWLPCGDFEGALKNTLNWYLREGAWIFEEGD